MVNFNSTKQIAVNDDEYIQLYIDEKKWAQEAEKLMTKLGVKDIFLEEEDEVDQEWIPSDEEGPKMQSKKMQKNDIILPLRDVHLQNAAFQKDKKYWKRENLSLEAARARIAKEMEKDITKAKKVKAKAHKDLCSFHRQLLQDHPRNSKRADVPYEIKGKDYNNLMDYVKRYEEAYKQVEYLRFEKLRRSYLLPNDSIEALRYNPVDKVYEAKCKGKGSRVARLPEQYVQCNFEPEFLDMVIESSRVGGDDFQDANAHVVPLEEHCSFFGNTGADATIGGTTSFYGEEGAQWRAVVGIFVKGRVHKSTISKQTKTIKENVKYSHFSDLKWQLVSSEVDINKMFDSDIIPTEELVQSLTEKADIAKKESDDRVRLCDRKVKCEIVTANWLNGTWKPLYKKPCNDHAAKKAAVKTCQFRTLTEFIVDKIPELILEDEVPLNPDTNSFEKLFFPLHTFTLENGWVDSQYGAVEGNDRLLRYVSNRKQFTDITWSEKRKEWCGRYIMRNGKTVLEHNVSQDWMDQNFSLEFQNDCKERSKGEKKRVFCGVPVGTVMNPVVNIPDPLPANILVPEVFYQQGSQDLCFSASLASAFHHMKWEGLAREIHEYGISLLNTTDAWKNRLVLVQQFVVKHSDIARKRWTSVKLHPEYDIFQLDTLCQPALIVPRGSDSSVNHAFTILNNFIFDSNNPKGIPLTIRNIEAILSSGFEGIAEGYLFLASKKQSRRKRNRRGKGGKDWSSKRQKT